MPTRRKDRGGTYYVKRRFPGIGLVYRSLGTRNKARATTLEDILGTLHGNGRLDIIRAYVAGDVPIARVAEFYESDRTHELVAELRDDTPKGDVPLGVACEAALTAKGPDVRTKTLERYRQGLAHLRRFAGENAPIADVLTTDRIQEFKAIRLAASAAEETINNDLTAVSVLATYALGPRRRWIEARPEIKRYEGKERIRYLDPGQLTAYMAVVRRPFRAQMQLLVGTGMRLGETEELRVCDLRFDELECRVLVRNAKTPSGVRPVFVPRWAAEAVAAHVEAEGASDTDPVFTILRRSVQSEHTRACKLAGIHDYVLHDHRHSAAVALARAGMPLHLLQAQLGHKHIEQTLKYARFNPEYADVSKYFERVGDRFGLAGPGNRSSNRPGATPTKAEAYGNA